MNVAATFPGNSENVGNEPATVGTLALCVAAPAWKTSADTLLAVPQRGFGRRSGCRGGSATPPTGDRPGERPPSRGQWITRRRRRIYPWLAGTACGGRNPACSHRRSPGLPPPLRVPEPCANSTRMWDLRGPTPGGSLSTACPPPIGTVGFHGQTKESPCLSGDGQGEQRRGVRDRPSGRGAHRGPPGVRPSGSIVVDHVIAAPDRLRLVPPPETDLGPCVTAGGPQRGQAWLPVMTDTRGRVPPALLPRSRASITARAESTSLSASS